MGATNFSATMTGKNAQAAFDAARNDAAEAARYDHEEDGWGDYEGGYTGTIAEKSDFTLITLPARVTLKRMQGWLAAAENLAWAKEELEYATEDAGRCGSIPKATRDAVKKAERAFAKVPAEHQALVSRVARIADDKWGPAVAIEITGKAATDYRKARGISRGKVFHFFGTASC